MGPGYFSLLLGCSHMIIDRVSELLFSFISYQNKVFLI